ncbi:PEP-CTERM sorting domain-containing protein [Singulisphaera sp. PoT]|uniref:PEP-CTERM sorting domain-containing protein n=1 Tax=Singulisphaera sp. PoT TaxID=3411797 RepID=UPI003BF5B9E4
MHRMRRYTILAGLSVLFAGLLSVRTSAELIQQPGGRNYPDLAGSITGEQSYDYDPATQTGNFRVTNTPYLLSTGPAVANESIIQPDSDGTRTQILNLRLDQNGRLINDASNSYSLYGSVNIAGQEYRGLLLSGTPKAFGSQAGTSSAFNLDLKVTGGLLANTFGPDLYMEMHPELNSAFDGNFNRSFATTIDSSNTLGYNSPLVATVPEPTTLVVLLACGVGLVFQRCRKRYTSLARPRSGGMRHE